MIFPLNPITIPLESVAIPIFPIFSYDIPTLFGGSSHWIHRCCFLRSDPCPSLSSVSRDAVLLVPRPRWEKGHGWVLRWGSPLGKKVIYWQKKVILLGQIVILLAILAFLMGILNILLWHFVKCTGRFCRIYREMPGFARKVILLVHVGKLEGTFI